MTGRRLLGAATLVAVTAGLLVGLAGSSQAAGPVDPVIIPPGGQTAVKDADILDLGGTVGPGATGVNEATLQVYGPSGNTIGPPINRTAKTDISGTTIDGGSFEIFRSHLRNTPQDNYLDAHGGWIIFRVSVQFTDGSDSGESEKVMIDLQKPTLAAAELKKDAEQRPRRIDVQFSEDVDHPDGDLGSDWKVTDIITGAQLPVSDACCDGFSNLRTLTLAQDADPDAKLKVAFSPTVVSGRSDYLDRAGNFMGLTDDPEGNGGECVCALADDVIPPAIPTIQSIAGDPPNNAIGNDPTPSVVVGNIRSGNTAEVYLESDPGPGASWSPNDDSMIGSATAGATGTATVETCSNVACENNEIGPDNIYTLYAAARDPSHNPSGGAAKGTYKLDRKPPTFLFVGTSGAAVDVFFTEVINGARIPANWMITNFDDGSPIPVLSVTGNDGTDGRVLTPATNVPLNSLVRYSGNSDGMDPAGNPVPPQEKNAGNGLAPFARIAEPAGKIWTSATQFTIKGTTQNHASSVSVFRDDNNDGTADNENPVATASVASDANGLGSFSVSTPLQTGPSVDNNFVIKSTRTNVTPNITGPDVDVPTIVQDSADPTVTLTQPDGHALAGGAPFTVRWNATDPGSSSLPSVPSPSASADSFEAEPISIEYSTNGGALWKQALDADNNNDPAGKQPNDGQFNWRVPDENATGVLLRVTAEDRADRTGSAVSPGFTIDADNPFFSAITQDASHVLVQFSEPVSGVTTPLEWLIDGSPAKSISPNGQVTGINELTLETFQAIGKSDKPEIVYSRIAPPTQLTDGVGNEISPVSAVAADGIPPAIPTVTFPTTPVMTGEATQDVIGTSEEGTLVTVYRDDGNDGTADAEVGSLQLAETQTAYTVAASLVDGTNELLVSAKDADGNESGFAGVPTITADLVPPVVTLIEPVEGQLVAGGGNLRVLWTATDANLKENSIKIEYSFDGGTTFVVVGQSEANDGLFAFALPNEAVAAGMVRVTAADIYDREGSATSGPFSVLFCEIAGTNGPDHLIGTDAAETICPYDGDDFVEARAGDDIVLSGTGRKTIDGEGGADTIEGGPDDDVLKGGDGDDDIRGRAGNDRLFGDSGKDLLAGNDGNDEIRGGGANDRLLGGAGNDRLLGDDGNDNLLGEDGNDRLDGDADNDNLLGGGGDDTLFGDDGGDDLAGGDGDDKLVGGLGDDTAVGDAGNDKLLGNTGNDVLKGLDGNDRLSGGAGNDRLVGMKGRDRLSGGAGNDRLGGGPGRDNCNGGSGVNLVGRSCEKRR